jgi:hypothetical protein
MSFRTWLVPELGYLQRKVAELEAENRRIREEAKSEIAYARDLVASCLLRNQMKAPQLEQSPLVAIPQRPVLRPHGGFTNDDESGLPDDPRHLLAMAAAE